MALRYPKVHLDVTRYNSYLFPHRSYILSREPEEYDFDMRKVLRAAKVRRSDGSFGTEGGIWQLEIHPTNFCNLNCTGCSYADRHDKQRIDPEHLRAIIDYYAAAGLKNVFVSGGGDPAFWPDWEAVFRNVDTFDFSLGVATNLSTLRQIGKVLDLIDYFQLHIVGYDRASVKRETGRDCFKQIDRNIDELFSSIETSCSIAFKILVKDSNVHEMSRFLEYVGRYPCSTAVFKLQQNFISNGQVVADRTVESLRSIIETSKVARQFPLQFDNLDQAFESIAEADEPICHFPETGLYRLVRADGLIYPCVASTYDENNSCGVLFEQVERPLSEKVSSSLIDVSKCPLEACRHHLMYQLLKVSFDGSGSVNDDHFPESYLPGPL